MNSSRYVAFVLAVLVLLGSGIICYSLEQESEQLEEAVARLDHVPVVIGAWRGQATADEDLDERSFAQAGAKGYWIRTYIHQRSNASVTAILMCGRAGKMSVHTPDVCYRGAGYELNDQPKVYIAKNELGDELSRFWTGQFTKKRGLLKNLRLYWAWNSRGTWEASQNPRWNYRGEPFLYKLYVSHDLSNVSNLATDMDPAESFLRQLLPEMSLALFPQARQSE